MPRWLSLWLGATLFIVWTFLLLVCVPFVISQITARAEPPMNRTQKDFLADNYPGGVYVSDALYKWCDGRTFYYFDSRGNTWHQGQSCWKP